MSGKLNRQDAIIFQNLPSSIGFSLVNGLILAWVVWSVVDHEAVLGWFGILLVVALLRLADIWAFSRGYLVSSYPGRQFIGILASALVWGSSGLFLVPQDSMAHAVFLAFVVGGMAAGSTAVYSPRLSLSVGYLCLSILPLTIRYLLHDSELLKYMGAMLLIFLVGMIISARRNHYQIMDNIVLAKEGEQKEKLIQKSQDLINRAEELANLGAWGLKDGDVMEWSPQTYKICRLDTSQEPQLTDLYQVLHQDSLSALQSHIQSLRDEGREFDGEFALKDGRWIRMMGQDIAGQIEGAIQDISEQKKVAQNLLEAKAKAEQASQAKSRFLNSMSHELRTPLNAILGFSQLLELEQLNEAQKDYLMEVITAGHHLLDMVNELLEFSRIENNKLKMSLRTVDTASVLEEVQRMVSPAQQNYKVELRTQWQADLPSISVDRLRLVQSLSSFINNMIKQSQEGSRFHLIAHTQKGFVVIECAIPKMKNQQTDLLRVVNEEFRMSDGKLDIDSLSIFLLKKFTVMMHGQFTYEDKTDVILFQCQFKAVEN